ncbi:MAG TPA: hypothetical protein VMH31_08860 [Methylomirabilota bacterium]|nr:hypothetical protein [Methylomirabilota bacterium]
MSLLFLAIVIYGFSHTLGKNLLHPAPPRPLLLYVHGIVFFGWVLFFILQSALVRTRNVRLHRRLGWFGVALGSMIPPLGIAIAIVMERFHLRVLRDSNSYTDIFIPLWDIACFTLTFALAILWRKKPEFHRRLLLIASCALTAAAWGRVPEQILNPNYFYSGVDFLILLGVLRDLLVSRRVHAVYLYALPAFILGQIGVMHIYLHQPALWVKLARVLVD